MTIDLGVKSNVPMGIHGSFWRTSGAGRIGEKGDILSRKLDPWRMFPLILLDELLEI
jgi:hypothetical protein